MRHTHGFTLIEVLTAVTILGVALFVLLSSQWSSLNIHSIMNEEVTLGQLVETVVGKAEFGVLTGVLSDGGDFGTRYPDYTWSYDAALSSDVGSALGMETAATGGSSGGNLGPAGGGSADAENQLYEVQVMIEGPDSTKEITFFVYNNNPEDGEGGLFGGGDNFGKNGFGPSSSRGGQRQRGGASRSGGF